MSLEKRLKSVRNILNDLYFVEESAILLFGNIQPVPVPCHVSATETAHTETAHPAGPKVPHKSYEYEYLIILKC